MDPYRSSDDLEFDNPYAAPKSSFVREAPSPSVLISIPFSIDGIISSSWAIFRDNLWPCVWLFWGMVLLAFGFRMFLALMQIGLQAAMPGDQTSVAFLSFGISFCGLVVQTWLEIGLYLGLLKLARGEPISAGVLFSGGRYLWTAVISLIICVSLLVGAMIIPAIVGVGIVISMRDLPGGFTLAIIGVSGSLFMAALYVSARLLQYFFLVIDQDAGIIDSIQKSWELTRGRSGTIILMYCVQLATFVGGILALCMGAVVAWPFIGVLRVVLYLALIGPQKPREDVVR